MYIAEDERSVTVHLSLAHAHYKMRNKIHFMIRPRAAIDIVAATSPRLHPSRGLTICIRTVAYLISSACTSPAEVLLFMANGRIKGIFEIVIKLLLKKKN